jgi:PAS domain S-box-containing protein
MDEDRGNILVVDDEESIRRVIAQKLQKEGYNCVLAANGSEALQKASEQDFDLVLMDIKMPGMSGVEVLPHLTFENPDVCVVMSTGVNDTQTTVEAMNLGAYDYVLKPFDLDDLAMRVEMALERRNIVLESRIRASRHYSALIENLADAVFEFKKGMISWCNDRAGDLLGCKKDELVGMEVSLLFPEIQGEIETAMGELGRMHGTTTMTRKDGSILDMEYSASKIEGKEPVEIVAVVRDITERKRAQEQLELAEERYRTIFENSAVAITVTDENENIISWNKLAELILGMGKDDLYMKPVSSLYPEQEWQKIRSQNVRQKGLQSHMETRILTQKQDIIDVDLSLSILKGPDGRVTGSIGIMNDITELKKMQIEQEKLLASYKERADVLSNAYLELEEALAKVKKLSGL